MSVELYIQGNCRMNVYTCILNHRGNREVKFVHILNYLFSIRSYYCTILNIHLGLPVITLNNNSLSTFSLLPPDINRAGVKLLTRDVVLSTNLVGRWQTPDNATETLNSLIFPVFGQSGEGIYKFYVTDWAGEESLAIQVLISIIGRCL